MRLMRYINEKEGTLPFPLSQCHKYIQFPCKCEDAAPCGGPCGAAFRRMAVEAAFAERPIAYRLSLDKSLIIVLR